MIEQRADLTCEFRHLHKLAPVEQEIIVVEYVLLLLSLDIGLKQSAQIILPLGAPRKLLTQHDIERLGCINRARVDGKTRALEREALLFFFRETELVADQLDQVGGILPIMDREVEVETDRLGIGAREARADGMECSRPADGAATRSRGLIPRCRDYAFGPPLHLGCGTTGKGQEQYPARVGPMNEEMCNAMGERVGLRLAQREGELSLQKPRPLHRTSSS